jgi:DNA-binding response OmpR family regulator
MGGPFASHGDRVLVVDEPGDRDLLELGLEMAGYQVDVADDGEAGLIIAAARPPVAAIIDLRVPIIDGWLLAESLRGVFGEHMRLIAVTSRDERDERERSLTAGFDRHLVKPVSPNCVHQTLRQLLAHGPSQRDAESSPSKPSTPPAALERR